jgi:hypothetical protein
LGEDRAARRGFGYFNCVSLDKTLAGIVSQTNYSVEMILQLIRASYCESRGDLSYAVFNDRL